MDTTSMETTWIVDEIRERGNSVTASLRAVHWFKPNPEYAATLGDDVSEEFIDAEPDEEGADHYDEYGALELDISQGPDMHAEDSVVITMKVLARVET